MRKAYLVIGYHTFSRRTGYEWYHFQDFNKATLQEEFCWEAGGRRSGEKEEKMLIGPVFMDNLLSLDHDKLKDERKEDFKEIDKV
jgi:hypothetical protein